MDKKENYLQKLLKKRANVQPNTDSLAQKKELDDILEELVAAFPPGCFCPPSQQTITQIENALNDLLIWSTSAPITSSLKLELQDAINAVKSQLDAIPFSCCDSIKALEALEVALSKVVSALPTGQQLHLLGLLQQLDAIFAGYIACLACTPGPTGPNLPITAASVSFLNLNSQTVNSLAPINFNETSFLQNLSFNGSDTLTILTTGVYKLEFYVSIDSTPTPPNPILLAFTKNGNVLLSGNAMGIVTTGGEISTNLIISLTAGDSIQVINASDAPITIPALVTNMLVGESATLNVYRLF
ncbi:Gly-Xaa-Xaa repeat protein [Bacillus toyonensis]|uniref:Gly-Xaa-Xaa repeat protein n=1 Tax=Bacillus toyonensis TaxID=155322 RepID=UPI000BEF5A45|nr:Gly-Xaa-Xaa repeat protein [Bacillus toyonensis]PEM38420.1 hypothetical protein CN636_28120 [Bacillus toyonensis]